MVNIRLRIEEISDVVMDGVFGMPSLSEVKTKVRKIDPSWSLTPDQLLRCAKIEEMAKTGAERDRGEWVLPVKIGTDELQDVSPVWHLSADNPQPGIVHVPVKSIYDSDDFEEIGFALDFGKKSSSCVMLLFGELLAELSEDLPLRKKIEFKEQRIELEWVRAQEIPIPV